MSRLSARATKGVQPDNYGSNVMASSNKISVRFDPDKTSLPPSPNSSVTGSVSSSSSRVRRQQAEAELAIAKAKMALDDEEAQRKLEARKTLLDMELSVQRARIA